MARQSKRKTELEMIAEAIDYRLQGHDYPTIADALNEGSPGKVHITAQIVAELVAKGLNSLIREPAKEATLLELSRINQMLTAVYANAAQGDAASIEQTLKLMDRRAKLEQLLVPASPEAVSYFPTIKSKVGGRRAHEPTQHTYDMVLGFVVNGVPQARIAKHIGIDEKTLRSHYGEMIDRGKEAAVAEAATLLANHYRRGNLGALIFFLKTQGRWAESHSEPSGGGSSAVTIRVIGGLPQNGPPAEKPAEPTGAGPETDTDTISVDDGTEK